MYQVGKHLTNPYFVLLVVLAVALGNLWRRRREKKGPLLAVTIPYVLLVVLSLPVIGHFAVASLEAQCPGPERRPDDAQAIVVLGGGHAASAQRCARAAALYRQGAPCPVLVSSDAPGVRAMADQLGQLGVAAGDLLEDPGSQNTYENAVQSRDRLQPRGIRRIVLVTDAVHMPRAAACFRKQGFDVVPAGCPYDPIPWHSTLVQYLPNADAAYRTQYAAQEWLGLAWYWVAGRT